jgi:hypothetical protein
MSAPAAAWQSACRGNGEIVGDVTGRVEKSILSMAGVRIERDIGDHAQGGEAVFQGAHRPRDQPLRIPCFAGIKRLLVGADHGEDRHRRDPELETALRVGQQEIDALAGDAGQGRHRIRPPLAVLDERGIDQVARLEPMLPHELARKLVAAHAARPSVGKFSGE